MEFTKNQKVMGNRDLRGVVCEAVSVTLFDSFCRLFCFCWIYFWFWLIVWEVNNIVLMNWQLSVPAAVIS